MKWFHNMKISAKLITTFVIVAFIAGIVGFIGIINIKQMDRNDNTLYENMTVPLSEVGQMSIVFQKIRVNIRNMVLEDDLDEINSTYKTVETYLSELHTLAASFEKTILADRTRNEFNNYLSNMSEFESQLETLVALCKSNKDEEALLYMKQGMTAVADAIQSNLDNLVQIKIEDAQTKADENTRLANSATLLMIFIVLGGVIISVILGLSVSHIISTPIRQLADTAERIADGDLNVELDIYSRDEIGNLAVSFRKMSDNLNEIMTNITFAADQVATGSKQLSDSSIMLSQGATEQASSIEELTASLEEISSQVRQNAENAKQANDLADTAQTNAAQGKDQMNEMLKAMEEINSASNNISKIIKVIDDIAFQTNILALNAAVEAARAGQHGKGFAVVAEEVRNLAARSANAAKETTAMIEGSIKKVETGTKIANETAEALNNIVQRISKVANLIGDIATASSEQANGIAQINQGIMQISQVVQTNSATSEESAAASEELASQADMLRKQVTKFKLKHSGTLKRSNKNVATDFYNGTNREERLKKSSVEKDLYGEGTAATTGKIILNDSEFGKY
ncbi:methyl-accepting chemotaxis protein [Defluviitalea raffinosedens]|uniref:methyl-accepting chemotaxis protein n=1 Tax=Defluviitalea raffinosedens TaxID=1450156 RepID=UPI0017671F6C|nr:methyl-accepting chemotaxis protein [Defluviitalea raffinosedens]MBM7685387.1 methyl-accepting chemotaxis protein [Defluviitalea raffinosedens]HHW66292.1 HAMP domain-containing protein [Candidatus Epulonipiscium sp.]